MGPKMVTHIFYCLVINFQLHRTLLHKAFWQDSFCVIWRLHKVLSASAPSTYTNCLGINLPMTRTSVTQNNCFRIICVVISGLIVFFASRSIFYFLRLFLLTLQKYP